VRPHFRSSQKPEPGKNINVENQQKYQVINRIIAACERFAPLYATKIPNNKQKQNCL